MSWRNWLHDIERQYNPRAGVSDVEAQHARRRKLNQSLLAEPLAQAGFPTVMLGSDLCPGVTLDEVVVQALDGIEWVHRNAARVGGDARRIYVYGHSAGAHLAAMALAHDWSKRGLPGRAHRGRGRGPFHDDPGAGRSRAPDQSCAHQAPARAG